MKKIFVLLFSLILIFALSGCSMTKETIGPNDSTSNEKPTKVIDEFKEDMLTYTYSVTTRTYTVSASYETNVEEIIIPDYIDYAPVRYIERFDKFYNLKRIILPETVYSVDTTFFHMCPELEYNQYDNGLYLGTLTNPYFYLYKPVNSSIDRITVHPDCKIIGNECFLNMTKIRNVTLPDGIKRIGYSAFLSALNLESINLPDSLEFIDVQAFSYCKALKEIEIPSSIKLVSEALFANDTSLSKVTINEGIDTIMLLAFKGCSALTEITIPSSIKLMYENSFEGCSMLRKVFIDSSYVASNEDFISIYEYAREVYIKDGLDTPKCIEEAYKLQSSSFYEGYSYYKIIG